MFTTICISIALTWVVGSIFVMLAYKNAGDRFYRYYHSCVKHLDTSDPDIQSKLDECNYLYQIATEYNSYIIQCLNPYYWPYCITWKFVEPKDETNKYTML